MKKSLANLLLGGEEKKKVASGEAYSSNNQPSGSYVSMESILADPYQFSFDTKNTTLTREQFGKLTPEQQQVIWRKGLSSMGFTQTGENTFKEEAVMGLGGAIGSTLAAATSLIPGVGPLVSPILTPILSGIGEGIDNKIAQNNTVTPKVEEVRDSKNYLGYMLDGGKTPKSIKATHGGNLREIVNDVYVAKGRKHTEGGIKGDTNHDGQAEIEFEDGELYYDYGDEGGFFVNKDLSKDFISSFSKREDKIGNDTNEVLKEISVKENEMIRGQKLVDKMMKDGGYMTYAGGGPTAHNPLGNLSQVGSGIIPIQPVGVSDAWDTVNAMYSTLYNPETLVKGQGVTGIPTKDTNNYTTYKQGADNSMSTTTGDKLILAGQMVPVAYNLARGLLDKAEVVDPNYHPYEDNVLGLMSDRKYNPNTVQNQIDTAVAAGKESITQNSTSSSVTRTNLQKLFDNAANQKANADLQGQQMNNTYKAELANTYDAMGRIRMTADNWADEATWANQVAKDAYISTGGSQLGAAVDAYGNAKNQNTTNNILMNILGEVAGNYSIDKNGNIIFKG